MATILPFVLLAMSTVAPERDHTELGTAIATVIDEQPPLFKDDASKTRTAAFAVAVAFRESSLRNGAVGDHGRSFCAYQIHLPGRTTTPEGWSGEDLLADVNHCVSVGFHMLRQSIRIDGEHPLAFFARGPAWRSDVARRLSRDRVALAKRIHAAAIAALAKASSS